MSFTKKKPWILYAIWKSLATGLLSSQLGQDEADHLVLSGKQAKLVDGKPVILENSKIGKPEGWKPADLSACV